MRVLFLCFFIVFVPGLKHAVSQEAKKQHYLYNRFIADTVMPTDTGHISIFAAPILGHTPEAGIEYGISGYASFYRPSNIGMRLSSFMLKTSLTTKHSANFILDADIWSHQDVNHLYAELRLQRYPFYYYGIGNHTKDAHKQLLLLKLSHVDLGFEHMILPSFYIGSHLLVEQQKIQDHQSVRSNHNEPLITAPIKASYAAIGLTQRYDTRDNIAYTSSGWLLWLSNMLYVSTKSVLPQPGDKLEFNLRYFSTPWKNLTIGYDLEFQQMFMHSVPFYLLPQLGNDERMRGYYEGRYRDRTLLDNQIEARLRIIPRIALVAFAGAGTTFNAKGQWPIGNSNLKTSYGCGLRYFFDIAQKSTIRIDYAIGQKRPEEKRQNGLYITLGEAF